MFCTNFVYKVYKVCDFFVYLHASDIPFFFHFTKFCFSFLPSSLCPEIKNWLVDFLLLSSSFSPPLGPDIYIYIYTFVPSEK